MRESVNLPVFGSRTRVATIDVPSGLHDNTGLPGFVNGVLGAMLRDRESLTP